MMYHEIYEADSIFDVFRNVKTKNEIVDVDWIKLQVYGMKVIPEMFPSIFPELDDILRRLITGCNINSFTKG